MTLPDYTVWFRGKPACPCLAEWLPVYEAELLRRGVIKVCIDIAQLIGDADASGGTHSKGGAADLWQHDDVSVWVSRQMGAIGWERTPAQGFSYHQHLILRNCPHNSPARYQIDACLDGYNGLGSGGRGGSDDGPRPLPDRGWKEGIEWAKAQQKEPKPPKPPEPTGRRLTLATFNLLRGRSSATVVREVLGLIDAHDLDGLAVQEAEGYFQPLNRIKGWTYYADPEIAENGVLVPDGRGSNFYAREIGDGWTRVGGAHRGASIFPRVTIDGWCRVGSTHWPPGTRWVDGNLQAAPERVDDVQAWAAACLRFLERDGEATTHALLGDKNEAATTKGLNSPGWVAFKAGAKIGTAGGIDWGMAVGAEFRNVRRSKVAEKSDHEPIVMDVVES